MNEHYEYVMNDLTAKLFDKNKKRKISVEKYMQSMLAVFAASPASAFNQAKKNIKQVINADINKYKREKQDILDKLLDEVESYETDYKNEHADKFEAKTDKKEEVEQVESESETQDDMYTDEVQNGETSTALDNNSGNNSW